MPIEKVTKVLELLFAHGRVPAKVKLPEKREVPMTLRELSKLYYLKKLIERDTMRISELEARLSPGGMNLTGMPRSASPKNTMEEVIPLLVDLKERLRSEQAKYIDERKAIENYINSVDDYLIRCILSCRFVDLMTWNQTALYIGGGNTENSVKKACYRFLKKSEES